MYEWITAIITAAASIVRAISTAITARIQRRASRKQLIVEVLNKVVIPLLNKIENYESKCELFKRSQLTVTEICRS